MTEIDRLEVLTSLELSNLFEAAQESDVDQAFSILKLIASRAYADEDYAAMATWNKRLAEFAEENLRMSVAADAQYFTGLALFLQDEESQALPHFEIAESINETLGRDAEILDCLMNQMDCYDCLENRRKVIEIGERALNVARVGERYWAAGQTALKIANAYYFLDEDTFSDLSEENFQIALQYAEMAIDYFTNSGDTEKVADATEEVSDLLTITNRDSEALEKIQTAIDLLQGLKADEDFRRQSLSGMYLSKGTILSKLGKHELSIEALDKAISIKSQMSEDSREGGTLSLMFWHKGSALSNLGRRKEALEALEIGLNTARLAGEFGLYYRILEEQVWVLFQEDRDLEALFIARGAIAEYERQVSKILKSYVFIGFVLAAGECLINLERWPELLETLEKINLVQDYLIPLNRVLRLDRQKVNALYHLGNYAEALILLDIILDEIDENNPDEDIAECLEIRGKIKFEKSPNSAVADLQLAVEIYKLTGYEDRAQELIAKYKLA
jgi:tetratricopeptide (TPR) repeat protein